MFNVIEVVGISRINYSDAVKNAVNQIIKAGDTPSYFEVISQRGAVRDGDIEYQATIKAAIKA